MERERLAKLLALTAKVMKEHFEDALAAVGSSFATYLILREADEHPGTSQRLLASCVGIEGPTLTHHLDRLADEGLVRRVRKERDRRVVSVELTAAGRTHLDRVKGAAGELDAQLRSLMSDREQEILRRVLGRIRDHYSEEEYDDAVG
jgi:MarR family transcriptional regulator for hemolysin